MITQKEELEMIAMNIEAAADSFANNKEVGSLILLAIPSVFSL